MSYKSLIILTEGGKEIGFGHLTRTLSLATVFQESDYEISFIIYGDKSVTNVVDGLSYTLLDWHKDDEKCITLLKKHSLILLDSMIVSNAKIKKIESLNIPIIFIDDEKHRNVLDKGFVIDWTVNSEKQNYFQPQKEDVTYLLGSKYTPLRKPFKTAKKHQVQENIKSIFITFGGSDIRDLTPKVVRILNKYFPKMIKNIVIGNGFENVEKIKKLQDKNLNLIYNADANTMIKYMQSCDIAIASGGQTLYELACIQIPSLSILVIENAKADTLGWDEVGVIKYIGNYDDVNLEQNLVHSIKSLSNKEMRKQVITDAKKYISNDGASLLARKIMERL